MLKIWKSGWIYHRPSSVQELLSELIKILAFIEQHFQFFLESVKCHINKTLTLKCFLKMSIVVGHPFSVQRPKRVPITWATQHDSGSCSCLLKTSSPRFSAFCLIWANFWQDLSILHVLKTWGWYRSLWSDCRPVGYIHVHPIQYWKGLGQDQHEFNMIK